MCQEAKSLYSDRVCETGQPERYLAGQLRQTLLEAEDASTA